jgi:hypothetical protein
LQGKKPTEQTDIYAREAIFLHEEPKRELKLQAIQIGDGDINAIPNEVFAITGLQLKRSKQNWKLCVIELANGAEGYIPPLEQHQLGGYTTWPARTAALEVGAESKIVDTLYPLLRNSPTVIHGGLVGEYLAKVSESKPAAHWSFEGFGGDTADDWGRSTPGGLYEHGIARYLPGWIDEPPFAENCVHFAGGRMKANLKDLGPAYTVEFFFWNGFPSNVRPVTGYLFSHGNDGDKQANGDHLGIGGTAGNPGKLIFFNGNAKNKVLAGKTELMLKEWYHVALVRDGKKVTVYLNGKEEITGEAESTVPEKCGQIFFGGRNDKFAGFEGKLDEAAIYNRALPAEEIARHVAAAKQN